MGAPDLSQYIWPEGKQGRQTQPAAAPITDAPFLTWVGGSLVFGPQGTSPTGYAPSANAIDKFGVGFHPPAANNYALTPNITNGPSVGVSFVILMTRSGAYVAGMIGSNNATQRCAVHLPYSDGTIYWYFNSNSAPSSGGITLAGVSDFTGCWVMTAGPLGMRIIHNGQILASSSTPISRPTHPSEYFGFGNAIRTADTTATYSLFHIEALQFSDAQAMDISLNPWSILSGPMSPFPSGAITVPTLSLATMSGITSTGGYPQVTRA